MRISALLLLIFTLLSPAPVVFADTTLGAGTETRAQRQARHREDARARIEAEDASVERGARQ